MKIKSHAVMRGREKNSKSNQYLKFILYFVITFGLAAVPTVPIKPIEIGSYIRESLSNHG